MFLSQYDGYTTSPARTSRAGSGDEQQTSSPKSRTKAQRSTGSGRKSVFMHAIDDERQERGTSSCLSQRSVTKYLTRSPPNPGYQVIYPRTAVHDREHGFLFRLESGQKPFNVARTTRTEVHSQYGLSIQRRNGSSLSRLPPRLPRYQVSQSTGSNSM